MQTEELRFRSILQAWSPAPFQVRVSPRTNAYVELWFNWDDYSTLILLSRAHVALLSDDGLIRLLDDRFDEMCHPQSVRFKVACWKARRHAIAE